MRKTRQVANRLAPVFEPTYLSRFDDLVAAIASRSFSKARTLAEPLGVTLARDGPRRAYTPLNRAVAVFARDGYACRYCLRRTIALPVLQAVSFVCPRSFKLHADWNTYKTDVAYFVLCTVIDHVVPVTRGGSDEIDNLVTACAMCHGMKANFLVEEIPNWSLREVRDDGWRGLTQYLPRLVEAAGLKQDVFMRRWLDALAAPEDISLGRGRRKKCAG